MSLDLGSGVSQIGNSLFSNNAVNFLLTNNVSVAILIVALMMLIVAAIYPSKKSPSLVHMFKIFFYSLLSTLSIVFLHDSCVEFERNRQRSSNESDDLINSVGKEQIGYEDRRIPVKVGSVGGAGGITGAGNMVSNRGNQANHTGVSKVTNNGLTVDLDAAIPTDEKDATDGSALLKKKTISNELDKLLTENMSSRVQYAGGSTRIGANLGRELYVGGKL